MSDPLFDPLYWKVRIDEAQARGEVWKSVYICHKELWDRVEAKHREILARYVKDNDYVLDAGCAYGRILNLLPKDWHGNYLGIDVSPDFIEMARRSFPSRKFAVGDLRSMPQLGTDWFDVAVVSSVRPMVKRHMGNDAWDLMDWELRRVARKLLYLEYDPEHEGSLE